MRDGGQFGQIRQCGAAAYDALQMRNHTLHTALPTDPG
ncbi:hypothetical protein XVE_0778 [Xanthomonas vesicatoria ATCC 35937]|uniref:Uncharacterized protein n=1 Tax=Xanthomonas vesicatoria ATCC 35937 TaxID=925775 RepID=F0B9M4_9XANT|nr:hypothetical protein XVE_0778 [Xanthomonas vesicatoria ATCC 35937]